LEPTSSQPVTSPLTLESVGLLGLIVLIRTFLSFALETEIEGHWPWRRQVRGIPPPRLVRPGARIAHPAPLRYSRGIRPARAFPS
jgi:hypothetical protein